MLEQTDEPANPEVLEDVEDIKPQRGLENNPGKDGHTFHNTHPYFPAKCSQCFAYKKSGFKNRMKHLFANKAKDCYNSPYIDGCLEVAKNNGFVLKNEYLNGGRLFIHPSVEPYLIIDNSKGCSDRIIRKHIKNKTSNDNIKEVWLYEKVELRLFYKKGIFYKNNGGQ